MGLPFSSKKETAFIETGFNNRKKELEKFKLHERSQCHKEAVFKSHTMKLSEAEEMFVGFYGVESTTSAALYSVIKDVLLRFNLPLSNCRGQCYDGARNMAEAHRMIATLKASLSFCQKDFSVFWQKVISDKPAEVEQGELRQQRKRKIPKRFETNDLPEQQNNLSLKEIYQSQYVEIIDAILKALDTRFESKSFKFILEIEQFLLGDDTNKSKILKFYEEDIDPDRLIVQREMLLQILKEADQSLESINDIINYLNFFRN
ncbi:hypothetical protein HELRODRAFT_164170 [Helobdella robusta]|uniref:DUF4371 domain-containing protein n=1 Tax=Helobdella robusta TaxID=6412 RepID=T1EV14_HELRO|nr:hypothetical protein HELRODRAFT_164170 [Helobdella robusta]ESN94343.1 hypothetical protein HELRODRAFT_164170 [Helobdella robusta]